MESKYVKRMFIIYTYEYTYTSLTYLRQKIINDKKKNCFLPIHFRLFIQ